MAATRISLNIPSTALTAATARTVGQLVAAANQRVKITGFGLSFDGVSTTAQPVQVRILRQTDAGTTSAGTITLLEKDLSSITPQTTGRITATAEPTAGDVLRTFTIHPQTSYAEYFPFGQEIMIQASGRVGIEVNAPAGVNVRGWIQAEE